MHAEQLVYLEEVHSSLYKTELCRSFSETGFCRYGLKCQFAHGPHELRPVVRHRKYKTEKCKNYEKDGLCPYGPRCRFIHKDDEEQPVAGQGCAPDSIRMHFRTEASHSQRLPIFQRFAGAERI